MTVSYTHLVEQEAHIIVADAANEVEALFHRVDEIRLKTVERLDTKPYPFILCILRALFEVFRRPVPSLFLFVFRNLARLAYR